MKNISRFSVKIFLVFLICVFFSLPVTANVRTFMEKCLNSWVGYSIDLVIESWGYPSSEKEIANKHLYIWSITRSFYIPQVSNSYVNAYSYNAANINMTSYGGFYKNSYCNKILEVDSDNRVVSWQWEGNKCPGTYLTGKAWVNPKNDAWARKKEEKNLSISKNTIIYEYHSSVE